MKVLIPVHVFFPDHFYGTETYTLDHAKHLKHRGHDAQILTAVPPGEKGAGTFYSTYEFQGLTVHCIDLNLKPHQRFKHTYYRRDLYPVLDKIVSTIQPDIVHVTHLINHTAVLLEVLRDRDLPVVATYTDFFGICFNNKLERYDAQLCTGPDKNALNCLSCYFRIAGNLPINKWVKPLISNNTLLPLISSTSRALVRTPLFSRTPLSGHTMDVVSRFKTLKYLYGVYRRVIAPSQFLFNAYQDNGFYPDRLRKINFGINLSITEPFKRIKTPDHKAVTFGYIGQMAAHKGVDLLIDAFLKLRTCPSQNHRLLLYGPDNQDPAYMAMLYEKAGETPGIAFKGTFPREHLGKILGKMDVLVIPSRWYENSPLVLLYALAAKTPVIVTDVLGMSEFVENDVNGFTFQMNSASALYQRLSQITATPGIIERLSRNASYKKDVADHSDEVIDIYNEVLGETT